MKTTLAVNDKNSKIYGDLVEKFIKDSKLSDVSDLEKEQFLQLCVINQLNPFKKEVYAIPRNTKQKDGTYKKVLTLVIDYHVYLNRAEETGLLSGWNIMIKKTSGKVSGGKITIYRKDWNHPFEYEADLDDLKTSNEDYSLWSSKPELMVRKQLIRIGFSLAFPEKLASLDREKEQIDTQEIIDGEISTQQNLGAKSENIVQGEVVKTDEKIDDSENNFPSPEEIGKSPITEDMKKIIKALQKYTGEEFVAPSTVADGEILIQSMKLLIAKRYLQEGAIQDLTEKQINSIFAGNDSDIKLAREECLKHFNSIKK